MQPNTQRRMTADTGWGLWWGTMLHSKCASQCPASGQPVSSQCPVSGRTGAPTQILDEWGIYFIIWLTVALQLHVSFIVLVCKSFIRKKMCAGSPLIDCNIVSSVQVYVMFMGTKRRCVSLDCANSVEYSQSQCISLDWAVFYVNSA